MPLLRALFGLALLLVPSVVAAQEFPTRPIRLIVPFPAGGPNDIIARTVGQKMSELLGQPILIENRGGAGGVLGTDAVAKAEPDGYTIGLTSSGALAISSSLQEKIPYDPLKDFKPITLVVKAPEILAAAPTLPVSTMAELVALAKAKPGTISFASSGPGGMPHLAGELLKMTAGIDIVHIPYRGAAPAVTDLLASQVHIVFLDIPVLLPHIQSGKLKAIALGSPERAESVKDIPTTAEAGFPKVLAENWYGMVAPAATPPAVVAKIHKAAVEAIKSPEVRQNLIKQGAVPVGDTPEEFAAFIRSEIERWRAVVVAAGIKPGQ